jgi:hypothetical protein
VEVCWRLDRLGRNLRHLVALIEDDRSILAKPNRQRQNSLPPLNETLANQFAHCMYEPSGSDRSVAVLELRERCRSTRVLGVGASVRIGSISAPRRMSLDGGTGSW